MTDTPTCGQLYASLAATFFPLYDSGMHGLHPLIVECPEDPPAYASFALGFLCGQAEKVYSGACRAFMIRPASAWFTWTQEAMQLICGHYGLIVETSEQDGEVWGCADTRAHDDLMSMLDGIRNSRTWHLERAELCGIPPERVDMAYHTRESYGVRCEPGGGAC